MSNTSTLSSSSRRLAAFTRQLQPIPCTMSTRDETIAELAVERARASFCPRVMADFLYGGKKQTELRLESMKLLEDHLGFRNDVGIFDRSLEQQREHSIQRFRRLHMLFMEHDADVDKREALADIVGVFDLSLWTRNGVHFGLFLGAIMDRATKWWIGGAGQTATHTVCFAKLVLPKDGGVDHGVQSFIVPLRDVETHEPLPGVKIGNFGESRDDCCALCCCASSRIADTFGGRHAETRLLDYQTHQYRLMPLLACAFAYRLQTRHIARLLEQFDIAGSDISEALLADIHGTMSGFKAFCTWDVQAAIDACRQSCGGNGYSKYTGLADLLADFSVMYLEREQASNQHRQWGVEGIHDLNDSALLCDALDVYTGEVLRVAVKIAVAEGNTELKRVNSCLVDLVEIARVHELDRGAAFLLKEKFMSSYQSNLVRVQLMKNCARVRADCVSLVDAFMLTDTVLNSSVGRSDGSIYEGAINAVRHRTGPTPYFSTSIKPMFDGNRLE
ncbi:unnamed protein product [Peronospora belbahrii]|uniref:Acyl-coenzyme A oxidase n=1 Tax=Peronospora belbahrii TaxID=622444 RepID=A0AAU9LHM4_9STRA|nr:unnamed protein product [Peronospora belbahrii]